MKNLIIAPLLFFATVTIGQNSDVFNVATSLMSEIVFYSTFIIAIYEVIVRSFPTVKSYSILSHFIELIQLVLPDQRRNADGTFDISNTHAHGFVRSITINDIEIGDTVKTKVGDFKVNEVRQEGLILVSNNQQSAIIELHDVIEVVKNTFTLINTVKSIWIFLKSILKKR